MVNPIVGGSRKYAQDVPEDEHVDTRSEIWRRRVVNARHFQWKLELALIHFDISLLSGSWHPKLRRLHARVSEPHATGDSYVGLNDAYARTMAQEFQKSHVPPKRINTDYPVCSKLFCWSAEY